MSDRLPALTLVLTVLTSLLPLGAEDPWPAFRGPRGDGSAVASDPPTQWSPEQNVRWRTELPGAGWSSPVIDEQRVYLTAAVTIDDDAEQPDRDLCLLIVEATTGRLLKNVVVMKQSADKTPKIHSKNTHASPTPILSGDRIYVHFGYQGTACLTRDGELIWENRELYFKPTHGNGGSPVLVDGKLVFTCDGDQDPKVVALDAETGQLVWQARRPIQAKKTFSFCTPTVIRAAGREQIIAPGSDCVLALDPATGQTIWDVRYDGYSVVPKPVFANGLVYLSTSFDNPSLLAVRPDGQGMVTDTHVAWQSDRYIPKTSSVIVHGGRVHCVNDSGIVACIDALSGELIYNHRLGGKFSASPLRIGELLYYTSEQGVTTVARIGGEQFNQVAENDLGERTLASIGVAGDALFVRTDKALYRIESNR